MIDWKKKVEKLIENVFVDKKLIIRLDDNSVTGEVDTIEIMDEIIDEIQSLIEKEFKLVASIETVGFRSVKDIIDFVSKVNVMLYEKLSENKNISIHISENDNKD